MRRKQIFAMAWENMRQRKLRTSLTTLGVVIGITAIIGLASLGEGFRATVKNRMEQGFELDVLTVIPGSFFAGLSRERFRDENVLDIEDVDGVRMATPVMQIGNVTLYNEDKKTQAFVATAVNFTEFISVFPDRFEFETKEEPHELWGNDTIVLGYKVNHSNETEPAFAVAGDRINMSIMIPTKIPPIENHTFTVRGTLEKKGAPGITNFDYWVFMPLETARDIYNTEQSDLIFVKVADSNISEAVAEKIEELFPPYQISILVPLTFIRQVDYILSLIQLFLTSIAAISLIVAGIGIMNITTVSVMERTREIGIMKAIGAKNITILTVFLSETALIGLMGSLIGIPTGYGIAYLLSYVITGFMSSPPQQNGAFGSPEAQTTAITPVFSWTWVVGAIAFGLLVCILFGLYPARKASKLDPVEALRYE